MESRHASGAAGEIIGASIADVRRINKDGQELPPAPETEETTSATKGKRGATTDEEPASESPSGNKARTAVAALQASWAIQESNCAVWRCRQQLAMSTNI